jgi:hypothetical protein
MNRNYFLLMMLAVVLPFTSCNDEETVDPQTVVVEADFNKSANSDGAVDGWKAVFAEYPDGEQEFYELASGSKNLPEPLDQTKKAFMLSGNNHSDALQMWLVKQLIGLASNAKYTIETEVELASKYPDGSVGIGGSPGNAVHLVSHFSTGGYTLEKKQGSNIQFILSKTEEISDVVASIDLGDVSINSSEYTYQLITRKKSSSPAYVRTDSQGKLWAIVGTWSGFEGISTLYYTRIKITLTRI